MLLEDQAAELLRRCEQRFGRRLDQIRGNLRVADTRAAAVWELLCIDAWSKVASIVYEPTGHASSPDLVVTSGEATMWVEVAFLYPSSWKNDRRERELQRAIYKEVSRRGIPAHTISTEYFGVAVGRGKARSLPDPHVASGVINASPVRSFFEQVRLHPDEGRSVRLDPYSVIVHFDPNATGPYITSRGEVDTPSGAIEDDPLYRVLARKSGQHRPNQPYLICAGSDQGFSISRTRMSSHAANRVIAAIFVKWPRVSGIQLVSIEDEIDISAPFRRRAHARLHLNSKALHPIDSSLLHAMQGLDFNSWRFYFSLGKWQGKENSQFQVSRGPIEMQTTKNGHGL